MNQGDMAYKHWKITIWEHGRKEPLVTEYMGDVTEHDLIRHYGLKNPDVNRYKIEVIKDL